MAFLVELWESIFTPGTTPALIKATHASFLALITSLTVLIFFSKSIHFVNLLVIAVLLYATVIWFIGELEKTKKSEEAKRQGESENSELKESVSKNSSIAINSTSGSKRKT